MAWNYSNTSVQTTLSAPVAPGDTTITIVDATGLPVSFPFTLILDYNLATVEVVTVTNVVGLTLTVTRGQDGTSAQSHSAGGPVVHGVVARDLAEPQAHIAASGNVHGIGAPSSVVGTATIQTLTNKTISGSSNTITNIGDSSILALAATKITGSFTTITATGAGSFGSLTVSGSTSLAGVTASAFASLQLGVGVSGGNVVVTRTVGGSSAFDAQVTGDTNPRYRVQADGSIRIGPGNATPDIILSRAGGNALAINSEVDLTVPTTVFDYLDCRVSGDTTERYAVHGDGKVRWGPGNAATDTVLYRSGSGELSSDTIKANISGSAESWHGVSFLNGFTNRGAGFPNLSYRKVAAPANSVQIIGQVVSGATVTSGTIIANLPAGYRPTTEQTFLVQNNTAFVVCLLAVETNGDVKIFSSASWSNGNIFQINGIIALDL